MAHQAPVNSPCSTILQASGGCKGTLGKQATTHDFDAEWELQHHYLRFTKSRGKRMPKASRSTKPRYFIAWTEKSKQYACAWLDVYGGASGESTQHPAQLEAGVLS
jgi:hypothetical protein